MTPYVAALKEALKEGLVLLQGAVTQPIGLTYDLQSLRQLLFSETREVSTSEGRGGDAAHTRGRDRPSPEEALGVLELTQGSVSQLQSLSVIEPPIAQRVQSVLGRVRVRLGSQLREEQAHRFQGLYVIVDPQLAQGDPLKATTEALEGGARVIQWRDKHQDKGGQLSVCQRAMELCRQHHALFIVNDHADLAAACAAHGLHLGQQDLPIEQARRLLSPAQLIGRSNATVEEAIESQGQGADYVAVGSIFPTATKGNTRPAGLETLRRVRELVQAPLVAIGGINEENVEEVIAAGADAVAVISAVVAAADPKSAAERLTERIERAVARRGKR